MEASLIHWEQDTPIMHSDVYEELKAKMLALMLLEEAFSVT